MSTHNICFMKNWRKLSQNYHQMLLLNNFSEYVRILSKYDILHIGLDKGGYPVNIFLISPRKHMLWVLIRSTSPRRF